MSVNKNRINPELMMRLIGEQDLEFLSKSSNPQLATALRKERRRIFRMFVKRMSRRESTFLKDAWRRQIAHGTRSASDVFMERLQFKYALFILNLVPVLHVLRAGAAVRLAAVALGAIDQMVREPLASPVQSPASGLRGF